MDELRLALCALGAALLLEEELRRGAPKDPHPRREEPPHPRREEPPHPRREEPPHPRREEPPHPRREEPPHPRREEPPHPSWDTPQTLYPPRIITYRRNSYKLRARSSVSRRQSTEDPADPRGETPPRQRITTYRRNSYKPRVQSPPSRPPSSSSRAQRPPKTRPRKSEVQRKRRLWVRSWNQQRPTYGDEQYYSKLGRKDGEDTGHAGGFTHLSRVFPAQFDALVELVGPIIHRRNTKFRASICVEERLLVTLHYLSTGESFKSLSHFFHMGNTTVRLFVPETLRAIYRVLRDKYCKCPDTPEEWQDVARGFQSEWDFPNCVGAVDGRHLNICAPPDSAGSTAPKEEASVSLMALVDSQYRFQFLDVAHNGRISNNAEFDGCILGDALEKRLASLPGPAALPGSGRLTPHCVVADKAFPLKDYLMKPYLNRKPSTEQQIFNYRISRSSKVAHDAFDVLASRFRILQNTFNLHSNAVKVDDIVMACCALHNFLCAEAKEKYLSDILDREEHNNSGNLWQAALPRGTNTTAKSKETRDEFCAYFMSQAGAIPSQYDIGLN